MAYSDTTNMTANLQRPGTLCQPTAHWRPIQRRSRTDRSSTHLAHLSTQWQTMRRALIKAQPIPKRMGRLGNTRID